MSGQNRLRQAQENVEDVKIIMLDNLKKSAERSEKLGELEDRAVELRQKGEAFSKTSSKVKQKKRWENNKYKVIIGGVVAAVVLIIMIVIIISVSSQTNANQQETSQSSPPEETKSGSG